MKKNEAFKENIKILNKEGLATIKKIIPDVMDGKIDYFAYEDDNGIQVIEVYWPETSYTQDDKDVFVFDDNDRSLEKLVIDGKIFNYEKECSKFYYKNRNNWSYITRDSINLKTKRCEHIMINGTKVAKTNPDSPLYKVCEVANTYLKFKEIAPIGEKTIYIIADIQPFFEPQAIKYFIDKESCSAFDVRISFGNTRRSFHRSLEWIVE